VAYVKDNRESNEPFDGAVNGETPAGVRKGAEIVEPYLEAGATWLLLVGYSSSRLLSHMSPGSG
jgi:hypothetical protein